MKIKVPVALLASFVAVAAYILYPPADIEVSFPEGKKFAFTIVDDTDFTRLEGVKPIYELLQQLGMRTTKTVWVFESVDTEHHPNMGDSLQDADYREFILDLQDNGFEIASHNARGGSSETELTRSSLREFQEILGQPPNVHINHSLNRENVYWGADRMTFPPYTLLYSIANQGDFSGEDPESPYFWGDLLAENVSYVRRFTFPEINLLKVNPKIPYHLSDKEFVKFWFPTANGNNADKFIELISEENLDRLEAEGGVCIVYTHFGAGSFLRDGKVNAEFEARMRDLASRDGWFVPATEILDYLRNNPAWEPELSFRERVRLETIFLFNRVVNLPR